VAKVALDSIPHARRLTMDVLLDAAGTLETSEVAARIGYPTGTTTRALDDLVAHGVAVVKRKGSGKANEWWLADSMAERLRAARELVNPGTATSPEMSGKGTCGLL